MPVVAEMNDEIRTYTQNWKMPSVNVGDVVIHYPNPFDRRTPIAADVVEVNSRSINLIQKGFNASGLLIYEVHHVDDPKQEQVDDVRKSGGWDFNAQTKRMNELEKRVETLESLMTEPGARKKSDK